MANSLKNKTFTQLKEIEENCNHNRWSNEKVDFETEEYKHRFNLYSVIWAIPSMIAVYFLFRFFYTATQAEWQSETTGIIFIPLVIGCIYFSIRFISIFSIIIKGFSLYSQARKFPIARMNYRYIKEMMKFMRNDFNIYNIEVRDKKVYDSISRLVILYKNEEICGSWFCYIVLVCGYYIYQLTNKIENFLKIFGITYFSNFEEKTKFNSEVNKHTEKVIGMMLKSVENLQQESVNYYKKAQEELNK